MKANFTPPSLIAKGITLEPEITSVGGSVEITYKSGSINLEQKGGTPAPDLEARAELAKAKGTTNFNDTQTDNIASLATAMAGKQTKGDYATNTALAQGLATKQPTGDYATHTDIADMETKTEANSKFLTAQSGAVLFESKSDLTKDIKTVTDPLYQVKGSYVVPTDLAPYAKTADVSTALDGKQTKGVYVTAITSKDSSATIDNTDPTKPDIKVKFPSVAETNHINSIIVDKDTTLVSALRATLEKYSYGTFSFILVPSTTDPNRPDTTYHYYVTGLLSQGYNCELQAYNCNTSDWYTGNYGYNANTFSGWTKMNSVSGGIVFADGDNMPDTTFWDVSPFIIITKNKVLPDVDFTKTKYMHYTFYVMASNGSDAPTIFCTKKMNVGERVEARLEFHDCNVYISSALTVTNGNNGYITIKHSSEYNYRQATPSLLVRTNPTDTSWWKTNGLQFDSNNIIMGEGVLSSLNSCMDYFQFKGDTDAQTSIFVTNSGGHPQYSVYANNCIVYSQTAYQYDFYTCKLTNCKGGSWIGNHSGDLYITGFLSGEGDYRGALDVRLTNASNINIDADVYSKKMSSIKMPFDYKIRNEITFKYLQNAVLDFGSGTNAKAFLDGYYDGCTFDFNSSDASVNFTDTIDSCNFLSAEKASVVIEEFKYDDSTKTLTIPPVKSISFISADINCDHIEVNNVGGITRFDDCNIKMKNQLMLRKTSGLTVLMRSTIVSPQVYVMTTDATDAKYHIAMAQCVLSGWMDTNYIFNDATSTEHQNDPLQVGCINSSVFATFDSKVVQKPKLSLFKKIFRR